MLALFVTPRVRLLALALVVSGQVEGQIAPRGQFRGIVVDPNGEGLREGFVRVLLASSNTLITRLTTQQNGTFQSDTLGPGSYTLIAWVQGFRARRLAVAVRDGETADVGQIQLDLAGCDAPGVICDDFGLGPPDPILKSGYVQLRLECGADLYDSRLYCPDSSVPARESTGVDLHLTKAESGIYLNASNGASLLLDCGGARQSKIRIDGFGPGDQICVQTHGGFRSHVFFVNDVEPGSQSITLWHVTRKP